MSARMIFARPRRVAAALGALGIAAAGTLGAAGASAQAPQGTSAVPGSALYVGAGSGFHSVSFGDQTAYAVGTSSVFEAGTLFASGTAAGPDTVPLGHAFSAAPTVQIGYTRRIPDTGWAWDASIQYGYLGASAERQNVLLPQAGAYTLAAGGMTVPFTGTAYVRSYQAFLDHQVAFVPTIGRVLGDAILYAGGGVTLSRTRTKLNGLIGFADIIGRPSDISGAPQDFSGSTWGLGGIGVAAARLFLDRDWFLGARYSVNLSASQRIDYASAFTNPKGGAGTTQTGTLVGYSSGRTWTQGLTITDNRVLC